MASDAAFFLFSLVPRSLQRTGLDGCGAEACVCCLPPAPLACLVLRGGGQPSLTLPCLPPIADEEDEDEAASCLWRPLRTPEGPSPPEPDPLDFRGALQASTSSPSQPTSLASVSPGTASMGSLGPSPPSSAPAPALPLTPGRTLSAAPEASVFEQQLLDSHRRQGALLASWSQQQGALMAQQNLLLQRLAEQSQRLADGVEALNRTLARLVAVRPAREGSPSVLESAPAVRAAHGPAGGPQDSPQGAHPGPEIFSGMILKVEEEL